MKVYRYKGQDERHFPEFSVTVKLGELIRTDKKVNHPDLEEIQTREEKRK